MNYQVGAKGQVVISKEFRDRLGVSPGFLAVQRLVGDHLEIRFFPPEHDRSLRGALADPRGPRIADDQGWRRARERAWAAAAKDKMAPTGSRR
jgi:hypothetical protein